MSIQLAASFNRKPSLHSQSIVFGEIHFSFSWQESSWPDTVSGWSTSPSIRSSRRESPRTRGVSSTASKTAWTTAWTFSSVSLSSSYLTWRLLPYSSFSLLSPSILGTYIAHNMETSLNQIAFQFQLVDVCSLLPQSKRSLVSFFSSCLSSRHSQQHEEKSRSGRRY